MIEYYVLEDVMSREIEFSIGAPVKKLPSSKKARVKAYDLMVEAVESKPKGIYPIEITGNVKVKTLYVALNSRLKGRKDLKLHIRDNTVFIEKL